MNTDTVEKVARLARITLSEEEKKQFQQDLTEVLQAFSTLDDFSGDATPDSMDVPLREDTPGNTLPPEAVFQTMHEEGFFLGPRTIE